MRRSGSVRRPGARPQEINAFSPGLKPPSWFPSSPAARRERSGHPCIGRRGGPSTRGGSVLGAFGGPASGAGGPLTPANG
eukprot:2742569-Alexandrium_andersonii.AAC.1